MNALQMTQLAALRTAQIDMKDADFLAWGTTPTYTESPTPVYVTYQKLRALSTKEKVDAVAAVVSKADPIGHQLLFTTGVDVNFPDAKELLKMLPTATGGIITDADLEMFRDIGRTAARPFDPIGIVTQADLDALPRFNALTALEQQASQRYMAAVTLWNKAAHNIGVLMANNDPVPADLQALYGIET